MLTCNHTLSHTDPLGTWTVEESKSAKRVICRVCKRFYGYIRDGQPPKRTMQLTASEETGDDDEE